MIPSPFHGIFSSSSSDTESAAPAQRATAAAQEVAPRQAQTTPPVRTQGQVALDIFEFDNYYIIKAPIAGVRMADIDIEVADNILTIKGARRQSDTIAEDQYYLQECFWGEFSRSVTLPCTIDPRKVKATFNKESILKILVPKEEKIKIIRIND